jgi:predicted nucleic acid-binding protein
MAPRRSAPVWVTQRGALERRWGAARHGELARHLGQYEVYQADDALSRLCAEVWTRARGKGRPVQVADAWISATEALVVLNPAIR